MIRLNCFFKAQEGKYDTALEAAIALTGMSQMHDGCIAYDVFESGTRGDVFMICETWKDQSSLDAHAATPEFGKYVGIMQECGDLKLEKFEF